MAGHGGGVLAIMLAEKVPRNPLGVLPQDLMINILEEVDLHRIAGPIDRLDAIDHRPSHAADEVAVEEGDRGVQPAGQFGLPIVPGVEIHVLPRDAAAARTEDVQALVAAAIGEEVGQIDVGLRVAGGQFPAEHPPRVVGVILRIAPGRHVENNARLALLLEPGAGELQAELGLADARGTDDDGQRARQQAAAQQLVQAVDACR